MPCKDVYKRQDLTGPKAAGPLVIGAAGVDIVHTGMVLALVGVQDVYKRQPQNRPNFDFFNYAGIHRPVVLYTTPKEYIEDVTVVPAVDGTVQYAVKTKMCIRDRCPSS